MKSEISQIARVYGVFPVQIGGPFDKAPAKEVQDDVVRFRTELATDAELSRWFGNGASYGVALHAGQHGLVCIDFDDPSTFEPWLALVREHDPDLAGKLCLVKTNNGYHAWYRCTASAFPTKELARFAEKTTLPGRKKPTLTRIETRGIGAYAIIPPTPGYCLIAGSLVELEDLTADDQELLIGLASTFDLREPPPLRPAPKTGDTTPGDRPGDWFNSVVDLHQLVLDAGGHSPRPGGHRTYYTRPGKTRGISLSIGNGARKDLIKIHTSNWPPFEMGDCLDGFGFYARLHHGGDLSAAAKAIHSRPDFPKSPRQHEAPIGPDGAMDPDLDDEPEFELNDIGNAARLHHWFGTDLRYCADWGRYLVWNGVYWHEDTAESAHARQLTHQISKRLMERRRTEKWGLQCGNTARINSMLREYQAFPNVCIRAAELDTNPWLLCASNGVIDLRTGQLVDSSRRELITKHINAPYEPDATCPVFETFLSDIMMERLELIRLLSICLGYSLTGSTEEQKFFMLYGDRGRNGKSTLMMLMQRLMGDNLCCTIRKHLLTNPHDDSNKFAKALIEGKRMVYANETSKKARFDVEFVKEFVAGDMMEAERKGRDGYQFKVQAKLWYAVNTLPGADFDNSFRSRLITIPFERCFYEEGDNEYREGDLRPDRQLMDKLVAELPGILTFLVRCCQIWIEQGQIDVPHEVKVLTAEYAAENDTVEIWINERCELGEHRQRSMELYADYREFCKTQGLSGMVRVQEFPKHLTKRDGIKKIMPNNQAWFTGIQLAKPGQQGLEGMDA